MACRFYVVCVSEQLLRFFFHFLEYLEHTYSSDGPPFSMKLFSRFYVCFALFIAFRGFGRHCVLYVDIIPFRLCAPHPFLVVNRTPTRSA